MSGNDTGDLLFLKVIGIQWREDACDYHSVDALLREANAQCQKWFPESRSTLLTSCSIALHTSRISASLTGAIMLPSICNPPSTKKEGPSTTVDSFCQPHINLNTVLKITLTCSQLPWKRCKRWRASREFPTQSDDCDSVQDLIITLDESIDKVCCADCDCFNVAQFDLRFRNNSSHRVADAIADVSCSGLLA